MGQRLRLGRSFLVGQTGDVGSRGEGQTTLLFRELTGLGRIVGCNGIHLIAWQLRILRFIALYSYLLNSRYCHPRGEKVGCCVHKQYVIMLRAMDLYTEHKASRRRGKARDGERGKKSLKQSQAPLTIKRARKALSELRNIPDK